MIEALRNLWGLLVLSSILLLAGILLLPVFQQSPPFSHFLITLICLTLINGIVLMLSARGIRRKGREGTFVLLASFGAKFLLYLLYILVFWLVTKNLSKAFIIVFFALYLTFTFFLAGTLLKLLKNK